MATAPAAPLTETDRAAINRENAQHSTGPVTPEGKQAVRLNALKSGIYAETVLLPHDDIAQYHAIGDRLAATYQPETDEEIDLVQAILDNRWRHRRLSAMEVHLTTLVTFQHRAEVLANFVPDFESRTNNKLTESDITFMAEVAGFSAKHRLFDQIWRQQGRLQRRIDKAARQLDEILAGRRALARARAMRSHPPASVTGFVPPKSEPAPKPAVLDGVPQRLLDEMPNFVGETAEKHQREWLKKRGYAR
jgi:hypothetical protein